MRKPYFISIPSNIRLVLLNSDKLLSWVTTHENQMNKLYFVQFISKVKLNRLPIQRSIKRFFFLEMYTFFLYFCWKIEKKRIEKK